MLKNKIPKLTAAAIALAGCGDSSTLRPGDVLEEPVDALEEAFRDLCKDEKQCSPEYFSEYFDSVTDCTEYYMEYYSDYLGASDECDSALVSAFQCAADEGHCEEGYVEYDCDTEFDVLYEACPDLPDEAL